MVSKGVAHKESLGLIGFGGFGQFFVQYLNPYFDVSVTDVRDLEQEAGKLGVKWASLDEILECNVIILGVPLQYLEDLLLEIAPKIKPGTLVLDVTSVKIKPVELMRKYLPQEVDIIATHPLFGPKSGENGIEGLNMAICDIRSSRYSEFRDFFKYELKLNVIETDPYKHDQEAGYVMGLTHFIGQALNKLKVPECQNTTKSFEHLMGLKDLLSVDSMDLFYTIQADNPYAKEARDEFKKVLGELENFLK